MYYIVSSLFNACVSWFLGIFVLYKNPKSKINRSVFFWCSTVALWSSAYFIWQLYQTTANGAAALFWSRALMFGAVWVPVAYFKLVCVFLEIEKEKKKLLNIFYVLSVIFTLLLFTPLMVKNVEPTMGFQFWPKAGIAYAPFLAMFLGLSLYSAYLSYKALDKVSAIKRYQIKYMLFGIAISIAGGSTNYFLWYNVPIKPYGNIFASTYVLMTVYAILRYRLMDIRIAIRQSVVYITSLIAVFGLGLLIWFPIGEYFLFSPIVRALLILFVGATVFEPIQNFLQKIANRHLFYSVYSYQETLDELSGELTTILDLDKLSWTIVKEIANIMKLDRAGMLLKNAESEEYEIQQVIDFKDKNKLSLLKNKSLIQKLGEEKRPITCEELFSQDVGGVEVVGLKEEMKKIGIELFLPVMSKNKIRGIIFLGGKLSGNAYSEQDLRLLETLANQTAVAIENAQLYDQVQDLTENLQERVDEQVNKIKDLLKTREELLTMKEDFLTTVSHQLRTPVSIFYGLLDEWAAASDERRKKIRKNIVLSAERLKNTVNDMLDAMEIERGMEFNFKETDLTAILNEIVSILKPNYDKKKLSLKLDVPKSLKIQASEQFLKQALTNIIDNAERYTKEGGTEITVYQEGKEVKIIIKDTGIGLTPEDKEKIFKTQFFRGDRSRDVSPDGSGLGLYIAKRIIDKHKGTVKVESEGINKGSTFIINLPI